jgi:pimeloyl-ACP methyl ester carboxylesterase
VITFSLADEPTCGGRFDAERGFDCYVEQIAEAMDQAGLATACICGVSYGGLIAAAFVARHPERVSALVLVSAIPPDFAPDARVRFYLRAPRLLSPVFMVASLRMYREIAAASEGTAAGVPAALRHAGTVLTHMFSPTRMARRVQLLTTVDVRRQLDRVRVPVLVVTGEASLDLVVPISRTEEYLRIWKDAERVTLKRTGHLGLITRPRDFAAAVSPFAHRAAGRDTPHASEAGAADSERHRRIG